MELPSFKYHPDPLATGSIEARDITCVCCGQQRPYVYLGPVYAEPDLDEAICPWCIASGEAHKKYDAEFTDADALGDDEGEDGVPDDVWEEIVYRTPGFSGWQQERWLIHCGDGCAFLGPAGVEEVEAIASPDLIDSLRADVELDEEEFVDYLSSLDRDGGPTAYIFRCLHCGRYQGYSDCD